MPEPTPHDQSTTDQATAGQPTADRSTDDLSTDDRSSGAPGTPRVSVVVPTYQRADTIARAVNSALGQTFTDLEVIVVDDAGDDATPEVLASLGDPRIRFLRHETNKGGNAARQTGIEAARGEWIAFLDSDDVWTSTKLERQLQRLAEAGPRAGFCYTWYDIELGDGTFLPTRAPRAEGFRDAAFIVEHAVGTFSSMLVARHVLQQVGGLDLSLPACQDWDFVVRVNQVSDIVVVPEVLVHYWHGAGDPHRITTRASSVIEGHRHMHRLLQPIYPTMLPADAAASRRYLMNMLANQGAFTDVARIGAELVREHLRPTEARYAARTTARAAKKRVATLTPAR